MAQKSERNWEKRLSGEPNALMMDYVGSLSFDQRLYKYDIAGSLAHAQMLAAQGLLSNAEQEAIAQGLRNIEADSIFVFVAKPLGENVADYVHVLGMDIFVTDHVEIKSGND